jgi:hypothetical protein
MPLKLIARDPDFRARFDQFVSARREPPSDVAGVVTQVLTDIRARGDQALLDFTRRFDRLDVATVGALAVTAAEIDAAVAEVPETTRDALDLAATRIEAFHRRQVPQDQRWRDDAGVSLGWRWTALAAVGIYVPGGTAAYPSSVLMNAIPAKVAGVDRIAMVVPAPDGKLNPLVLAAARRAGRAARSGASAAPRRSARSPSAPRRSGRSTRSSGPAMPMSPRPSARCSARSASTRSPVRRRSWSWPTAPTTRPGSRPTCCRRPSTTRCRNPS